MTTSIRPLALASALVLAGGCSHLVDIHAPKTVTAGADGGAVTVKHGARLRIPLATDAASGYEWHRVEPPVLNVVAEGPPQPDAMLFTPVRSGEEKLRFEYRPADGHGTAQRVVSYDVTVR